MIKLRCVIMRGGTSKAVFFHENDSLLECILPLMEFIGRVLKIVGMVLIICSEYVVIQVFAIAGFQGNPWD
jgi:hypothetical protein